MELKVLKKSFNASYGSYLVDYQAEVEIRNHDNSVQVTVAEGLEADRGQVDAARQAIQRGAEQALQPTGLGAIIKIHRLNIHPVDFKPELFERFTAEQVAYLVTEK